MSQKPGLGERIKQYRLERNLTLKEVEQKAKVSATHVSEIERGLTSPTIGALERIAHAMGCEPSLFLRRDAGPLVSISRRTDRLALTDNRGGATLFRIGGGGRGAELSVCEIEILPGAREPFSRLGSDGETFVHVLRGVVEVDMVDEKHVLKAGDSMHFEARGERAITNIGDAPAIVVRASHPALTL